MQDDEGTTPEEVETVFGFGRRKSHRQLVRVELGEGFGHFRQAATHAADGVGTRVGPRMQAARGFLAPTATRVAETAANGWGSTMTVIAPLAVAALASARQTGTAAGRTGSKSITGSKKMKMMKAMSKNKRKSMKARRRWTMLTGLLAAGAAVGAVGAVAMRRRHHEQWEAYDPARAMDTARNDGQVLTGSGSSGGSPSDAGGGGPTQAPARGDSMGDAPNPKPVTIDKVRDRPAAAGEKRTSTAGAITDSVKPAAPKSGAKPDGLLGTGSNSARNSRS